MVHGRKIDLLNLTASQTHELAILPCNSDVLITSERQASQSPNRFPSAWTFAGHASARFAGTEKARHRGRRRQQRAKVTFTGRTICAALA